MMTILVVYSANAMTLRQLRYLVAIADHGHFGRAAAACHVSQPTLSTQVRKLEETLGVAVFERSNRGVHLSAAGAPIVARARRVLAEAEGITEMARRATGPLTGSLALGVIPTLGAYVLPWLVPALAAGYPELALVVHEDLTDALLDRLTGHHIDAALVALPVDADDLWVDPLFDEPFFFVSPPEGDGAVGAPVGRAELAAAPLLLLTDGHCLRDQALAVCGLVETPGAGGGANFRATSLETIRQMVAAGMGATLMPAMALTTVGDADLRVRPLAEPAQRRIGLAWRRTYPRAVDMALFADVVRANLPGCVRRVAGA